MTNPEEGSDSAAPKTNQVQEKEKIDETGGECTALATSTAG